MYYLKQEIRRVLQWEAWKIFWEQKAPGQSPFIEVWWLHKPTQPGRVVHIGLLYGGNINNPHAAVRPAIAPEGSSEVEVVLSDDEVGNNHGRTLLRVLDYFHNPHAWDYADYEEGWAPPDSWHSVNWGTEAWIQSVWQSLPSARVMLDMVLAGLTERKQRLLCCALCRRLPVSMLDSRNVLAVEAAERYAEELCPRREMKKAVKRSDLRWLIERLPANAVQDTIWALAKQAGDDDQLVREAIREIVSDPFCPVEPQRKWLRNNGGAAGHLVSAIMSEGRFMDVPILADALEDAGCSAPAILDHLRDGGLHSRGCWVVDLLCGKPERRPGVGR